MVLGLVISRYAALPVIACPGLICSCGSGSSTLSCQMRAAAVAGARVPSCRLGLLAQIPYSLASLIASISLLAASDEFGSPSVMNTYAHRDPSGRTRMLTSTMYVFGVGFGPTRLVHARRVRPSEAL